MRVLISGAGVAGPTLAWWLTRGGHEVTIVEKAPRFRTGGYAVDFWGAGYEIVTRMGLEGEVEKRGYRMQTVRAVNDGGRQVASFPVDVFRQALHGRFTTVPRTELAAIIYRDVEPRIQTLFGNSVAALEQTSDGVRITFEHGEPRTYDLVVGADGLHSRIRELAFGPQSRYEKYLGFKVAAFEASGYRPREELAYVLHTHVGRQTGRLTLRGDRTMFLFVFADASPDLPAAGDLEAQKAVLRRHFSCGGWELPAILDALDATDHLYYDRVSQIRMAEWTRGRVTLIGDAASCPSLLAGEGSGLALVAAYVLASELARSDVGTATRNYEHRCAAFMRAKQQSALGFSSFFAPRAKWMLSLQHLAMNVMRIPWLAKPLVARYFADRIELPAEGAPLLGRPA